MSKDAACTLAEEFAILEKQFEGCAASGNCWKCDNEDCYLSPSYFEDDPYNPIN